MATRKAPKPAVPKTLDDQAVRLVELEALVGMDSGIAAMHLKNRDELEAERVAVHDALAGQFEAASWRETLAIRVPDGSLVIRDTRRVGLDDDDDDETWMRVIPPDGIHQVQAPDGTTGLAMPSGATAIRSRFSDLKGAIRRAVDSLGEQDRARLAGDLHGFACDVARENGITILA